MHPKYLSIKDFTYSLPHDRIAAYPLAERDSSKLLVWQHGEIIEDRYRNIAAHIPGNSLLVFNNSKVVAARLLFQKPGGGIIELFCLEPDEQYGGITGAMSQQGKVYWQCLVGGASKWKHGQLLEKKITTGREELILTASYVEKKESSFVIAFSWSPSSLSFAEVLQLAGAIPLPPYIKRKPEASDAERYQTVYARQEGSVAAPTAGLHFTDAIFATLDAKNIHRDFVTLHVGAGTFRPVKSEIMQDHAMHAEYIDVSRETIENILQRLDDAVIAVGTTSLRTIESLYWLGVKITAGSSEPEIHRPDENSIPLTLDQWEVYDLPRQDIPPADALKSLLNWMDATKTERIVAKTQIIIAPGYKTRIAKALITNFHQPQSTLLLLIAALIGKKWQELYAYALQHDYRFLSYGDGCLLWIP